MIRYKWCKWRNDKIFKVTMAMWLSNVLYVCRLYLQMAIGRLFLIPKKEMYEERMPNYIVYPERE